jgi:hypothetical protein
MALEMQQARRRMGYQWLEGGLTAMEGTDSVVVHARQSGLIVAEIVNPELHLHMERVPPPSTLTHIHRHRTSDNYRVAEYRFDEAMLTERMA